MHSWDDGSCSEVKSNCSDPTNERKMKVHLSILTVLQALLSSTFMVLIVMAKYFEL